MSQDMVNCWVWNTIPKLAIWLPKVVLAGGLRITLSHLSHKHLGASLVGAILSVNAYFFDLKDSEHLQMHTSAPCGKCNVGNMVGYGNSGSKESFGWNNCEGNAWKVGPEGLVRSWGTVQVFEPLTGVSDSFPESPINSQVFLPMTIHVPYKYSAMF